MRILIFQHLDVEGPGLLGELWAEAGHELTTVELDKSEPIPPLHGFGLLVVLGGPMDVWQEDVHPWLVEEKAAIRHWVLELERPFLGICLGHQLLADALGGRVAPMRVPEVGLTRIRLTPAGQRDPILADFRPQYEVMEWHGAEIVAPPPGAEILAANDVCRVQAMRCGPHAYGFQYHMEITAQTVSDWMSIPATRAHLDRALGADGAAALDRDLPARLSTLQDDTRRLNRRLFSQFVGV